MSELFDSLNPSENWEILSDRTPQGLLKKIKSIKTPIGVKFIFPYANRVYAIIGGDIRKVKKNGRSNSSRPQNVG